MNALRAWLSRHRILLILLALVVPLGVALILQLEREAKESSKAETAAPTLPRRGGPRERAPKPPEVERPAFAKPAAEAVKRIYAGPDFNEADSQFTLIPRHRPKEGDDEPPGWLRYFLQLFSPALAQALTWVLWVVMAALILWAGFHALRWFRGWEARRPLPVDPEQAARRVALGLHALPDDIVAAAAAAWRAGDFVAALSLLYRGALRALVDQRALRLPSGLTEGECQRAVSQQMPAPLAQAFANVTRAWSAAAYAAQRPAALDPLLITYAEHFVPPPPEAR